MTDAQTMSNHRGHLFNTEDKSMISWEGTIRLLGRETTTPTINMWIISLVLFAIS